TPVVLLLSLAEVELTMPAPVHAPAASPLASSEAMVPAGSLPLSYSTENVLLAMSSVLPEPGARRVTIMAILLGGMAQVWPARMSRMVSMVAVLLAISEAFTTEPAGSVN